MEYGRTVVYFSTYENGVKVCRSGYAGIFVRGTVCDVQIYYRGETTCRDGQELHPVYIFRDQTVVEGDSLRMSEGVAMTAFRTTRRDFVQSGRSLEELEAIYIDGVTAGICGGRPDGQELTEEVAYTLTDWMDTVAEIIPECKEETYLQEEREEETAPEIWTFSECLTRFPEMKLPFDGMRRRCCRMTLEDMEHLPKEWAVLANNQFLLHGYYEYHHILLAKLCTRYGEQFAIGVPGEFCHRSQYMAENFGFYDFSPLEPGKRRNGSFGYWLMYAK